MLLPRHLSYGDKNGPAVAVLVRTFLVAFAVAWDLGNGFFGGCSQDLSPICILIWVRIRDTGANLVQF